MPKTTPCIEHTGWIEQQLLGEVTLRSLPQRAPLLRSLFRPNFKRDLAYDTTIKISLGALNYRLLASDLIQANVHELYIQTSSQG